MAKNFLSQKNLDLIKFICENKFVTRTQIHKHFFAGKTSDRNVHQILYKLLILDEIGNTTKKSLISRDTLPMPAGRSRRGSAPDVYYTTKQNLSALRNTLSEQRRLDEFDPFEDFIERASDHHKTRRYTQNTLEHENLIIRSKLALESPKQKNAPTSLHFFLNCSPSHLDVSERITIKKVNENTGKEFNKTIPFNPDDFHILLKDGTGGSFYFEEIDNNTETQVEKITNKYLAYYGYHQQKIFQTKTLPHLNTIYDLGIDTTKSIGFRVKIVTVNNTRRNNLFSKSLLFSVKSLFHFTTLDELEADPYGTIWLRKEEFTPYYKGYLAKKNTVYRHKHTGKFTTHKPPAQERKHYEIHQAPVQKHVLRKYVDESIENMQKVSLP